LNLSDIPTLKLIEPLRVYIRLDQLNDLDYFIFKFIFLSWWNANWFGVVSKKTIWMIVTRTTMFKLDNFAIVSCFLQVYHWFLGLLLETFWWEEIEQNRRFICGQTREVNYEMCITGSWWIDLCSVSYQLLSHNMIGTLWGHKELWGVFSHRNLRR